METWTIIILGATGDLARRRLIPTLYEIMLHKKDLSFAFVGAAKEVVAIESLINNCLPNGKKEIIQQLITSSIYVPIDFTDADSFKTLAKEIDRIEKQHNLSGNRLVYFSVASQWYCDVTRLLTEYSIINKHDPSSKVQHRLVYEKPFGWDAQSARDINACITSFVHEHQIYRIDHYLSKALVTSLLLTRFSNVFFEPIWNAEFIDQVQITLTETITLAGRGDFYDQYGALKDVVQNHILQLLAFIAMDKPPLCDPQTISSYRSSILQHIKITDGLLGQYDGYRSVPGVAPDSTRETYALLRAEITKPRWKDVPFFIKTGKALDTKSTEIHIVFKPQQMHFAHGAKTFESNRLIIRISPDSAILLRLNAQKGREPEILPISMEYCYRCTFGQEQPHSYETLFYEIMHGDKSAVVSLDEIVYAWDCIHEIENLNLPLLSYTPGSSGPDEEKVFTEKYAIKWDQGAVPAKPGKD